MKARKKKQEDLELTKTLVLNLEEMEKVANYEKRTSKKPAIIFAVFGFIAICAGMFYPTVKNLMKKDDYSTSSFRKVSNKKRLTCIKEDVNIDNKIKTSTTVSFGFNNGELISYKKIYKLSTTDKVKETPKTIIDLDNTINPLLSDRIDGYDLVKDTNKNGSIITGYTLTINVDYDQFTGDLTDSYKNNEILNVKYKQTDSYKFIKKKMTKDSYSCS